jgi:hypothetical protein
VLACTNDQKKCALVLKTTRTFIFYKSHILVLKKTCHVSLTASNIVSKSPSETTDCPQTFIFKILIIKNIQVSGETERERERE